MSKSGQRLLRAAKEARAIAKMIDSNEARVHVTLSPKECRLINSLLRAEALRLNLPKLFVDRTLDLAKKFEI